MAELIGAAAVEDRFGVVGDCRPGQVETYTVVAVEAVRTGVTGWWDRLVGTDATWIENIGTVGFACAGAVWAPRARQADQPSRGANVALRLLALDLWGGAWCNNTGAAARWYHRPGQGPVQHLAFAVAHVHPFLLAWFDRETRGLRSRRTWAVSHYVYLLTATICIARCADRTRQRGLALVATVMGIALDRALGWSSTAPWFAAVYYLKLLAGHAGGAAVLPQDPRGG